MRAGRVNHPVRGHRLHEGWQSQVRAGRFGSSAGAVVPNEKNDPADRFGVTLSGLLNVLDGFHAPENVLFVMTTNRIEALDAALLRPGRIDYKLYMGKAADAQKIELYRRFFPEASEYEAVTFVESHFAETMAEFQGLLLSLEQEQLGESEVEETMALT
ncbi:MAG: hypothetical protein DMG93_08685 [Acidobacteria bacterium]|nr:MAG: hypothetical protein DMG93_08685 [Acidobacteriota bacterium]